MECGINEWGAGQRLPWPGNPGWPETSGRAINLTTSALIYEGRIVTYSDESEGVLQAWADGKEIRVDENLRLAIKDEQIKQIDKHRNEL